MKSERGRPKLPPKQPTPEQTAWIKAYYNNYTRKHMAKKLQVHIKLLRSWLMKMGIDKKRGPVVNKKPAPAPIPETKPKDIIRFEPQVKQQRPRADHTNMSREQRIEFWINYPI